MIFKRKRTSERKNCLKIVFVLFVFVFLINNSSNALSEPVSKKTEEKSPYSLVAPPKSLRANSRFFVIDDFSFQSGKSKKTKKWTVDKSDARKLVLEINKEDARNVKSGESLWLRYNLRAYEEATARTTLTMLDMSMAQKLLMQCRIPEESKFDGIFTVSLIDWEGKTASKNITKACSEKGTWKEVALPLEEFPDIDFEQLDSIAFTVTAGDKNVASKVGIDEIAFFGPEDVGFKSVADNLQDFPKSVLNEERRKELLATKSDKELLLKIARDTWKYFEAARDKENQLVVDHIKTGNFPMSAAYTSITNIAMDILATVAAKELKFLPSQQAEARIKMIFKTLRKLRKWKGFFYNFYETKRLHDTRTLVSTVDSAWLAVSLVVARQAFSKGIASEATAILNGFNFNELLDSETNQLAIGYDDERKTLTPYHYGMLATEARIASYYGIGKGDLPETHWWYLYRTAPDTWSWQTQKPKGKQTACEEIEYFQGYYEYEGKKFLPSWGGALFEFLMPTLVVNEKKFGEKNFGKNNEIVSAMQRDYAIKEKKYPVWGISSAATSDGRRWHYDEYGVRAFGVKGYADKGVITSHASFLALDSIPKDAIENIRNLLNFPIYGEYGFYDTISFPSKKVNTQYLALDQGMILIPIANYLKKNVIKNYFHKDAVGKKVKKLLGKEKFF